MTTARTWGDGGGDRRPHVIADISFAEASIECRRDGRVRVAPMTVQDAWDIHRGAYTSVEQRVLHPFRPELATDAEVADFLTLVADPRYTYGGDVE